MSFLRNLNFARVLILLCLLASPWLGWLAWNQYEKNESLKAALQLDGQVEGLVEDIQRRSREYTELKGMVGQEQLRGQANPESYIRDIARLDAVDLGDTVIQSSEKDQGDYVDKVYTVRPYEKGDAFPRARLANFFFKLESESRRVRVTDIKLEADGKLEPGDIPDDRWTFTAQVTSRQRAKP